MTFHSSVNQRVERQVAEIKREIAELRERAGLFSTLPDSPGAGLVAAVERLEKKQQEMFSELGFNPDGFRVV